MKFLQSQLKFNTYQWLILLMLLITVLIGLAVFQNQEHLIRQNLDTYKNHVQYKFQKSLKEQVALIERMALRWEHHAYSSETNWRSDAENYIQDYPYFQSISYLKNNQVVWTEGQNNSELHPGSDLSNDPTLMQLIQQASTSRITELSQPKFYQDGMFYTQIVTPIYHHEKLTGHLLFVSNTTQYLVDFFSTVNRDVVTQVYFNQNLVYQSKEPIDQSHGFAHFEINMDSGEDGISVYLYPSTHMMIGVQRYIPYVIWLGGLVMAVLAYLLMKAHRSLHDKTIDLAQEVKQKQFIQRKLEHMAHYDELTRLPNQHRLMIKLNKQIRSQKPLWLTLVDLGGLKDLNDTLGSRVIDEIIRDASRRLDYLCEDSDWLARLNELTFAMVIDGDPGDIKFAGQIKHVISALNRPFYYEDEVIHLSPHMGTAQFPDMGSDAQELVDHATQALNSAKSNNKNHQLYWPNITEDSMNRVELLTKIQSGIEKKEFDVLYQTRFDVRSQSICGAEGLIRWKQTNGTILSPRVFLDTLETSGLIVTVGWEVLSHALKQFVQVFGGRTGMKLSFNFSGKQLEDANFAEKLTQTLDQTSFPYQQFEVELTEQTLINNLAHHIAVLTLVREKGITVAIDGFGSGFTSLSYLKNLPVDVIKIDKGLIQSHLHEGGDQGLLKSLIKTGKNLGVKVVAEGINSRTQYQIIHELGCDEAQGSYFSKPVSMQMFKEILASKED